MSDRWRWSALVALVFAFVAWGGRSQAQTCAPTWSSTQVYTSGNQASLNGINYTANFWTQGNNPSTSSGPAGSGAPWTSSGPCSGSGGGGGGGTCAAAWVSTQAYTGGMQASLNGVNYQAAFWTQGDNPATHSGSAGSGQPWVVLGPCGGGGGGGCAAVPSVPTGLTSPSHTASSINLSWNASTAPAGCTIQYRVFQNGSQVQTVDARTITISGLPACFSGQFSVAAMDRRSWPMPKPPASSR
jgi:chitodextrinase